jgi:ubiquitin carboxyl-terminal hydrolase 4/11/15
MIRRGDTRNLVIVVQWRDNPPANLSIVQTPIVKSMNEDKNSIINPSTDSKITLYDCLNNFMVEETLSGNDKWYCGKCKNHVFATKKMEIYKIP